MIDPAGRRELLDVARRSVTAAVKGEPFTPEVPVSGPLAEERGAFVTLTKDGALRGCIGRVVANDALVRVVAEMAKAAALDDPRFAPLAGEELERISIEISAMSPVRAIDGPDDVVVGRDGLIIRSGSRGGLLLPQVAGEQGWDAVRFLEETCRKAGLDRTAWREGARIEAFHAEVWSE